MLQFNCYRSRESYIYKVQSWDEIDVDIDYLHQTDKSNSSGGQLIMLLNNLIIFWYDLAKVSRNKNSHVGILYLESHCMFRI